MKEIYTRVLIGNLSLQSQVFPAKGRIGQHLEAFSREALWQIGLDYPHGVGHGVSHLACVHEYPHYYMARGFDYPLKSGMIVTNEPGYYKEGHFGIRIENILHITPATHSNFLCFEPLTKVPYCKRLIDMQLMS